MPKEIFFSDKYYTIEKKELVILMAWGLEQFISSKTDNNVLPANEVSFRVYLQFSIINFILIKFFMSDKMTLDFIKLL